MDTQNYVCVHGHFYQPPRENPFTGRVENHPSAAPFPNWNERITEECYRANTAAAILGDDGQTVRELNTYEWISFDFGPTLLSWLADHDAGTYRAIIEADRRSAERFGGHGSAMAQSYNHTILPLSSARDKRTQIRWGVADFVHRFGRRPEGMWLPETAVDLESLEMLADEGILFTLLSPYQAASIRDSSGQWIDVEGGSMDTRIPYRVELPDDKSITVFFYNGPLSQEIAFNGLLEDGRILGKRLVQALGEPTGQPILSHVATDGESYGHHHHHGEMALAAAIEEITADPDVALTNYAEFRTHHHDLPSVRIIEGSSWSCAHGIERWRSDCGCSTSSHPEWSQAWRGPLREALDWLNESLIRDFATIGSALFLDPWEARDGYIDVIIGGSKEEFLQRHGRPGLDPDDQEKALGILEIQHRAMLMYTSCGWFFDDIAGLETVFVLRHAGRVIELARRVLGYDLEPTFLSMLEEAPSNQPGKTGRDIYEIEVASYMTPWDG